MLNSFYFNIKLDFIFIHLYENRYLGYKISDNKELPLKVYLHTHREKWNKCKNERAAYRKISYQ